MESGTEVKEEGERRRSGGGGGGSRVSRGGRFQIKPTLVPICGTRGPMESKKKGTKQGGREARLVERRKEKGVATRRGKKEGGGG